MTEYGDQGFELMHQLELDPYFSDWHQANRLLTRADIDRAIGKVLEGHQEDSGSPPDTHGRAMRRLALFQVVAPHLSDGPRTWIELIGLLHTDEVAQVEEILGDLSLGELLEEP